MGAPVSERRLSSRLGRLGGVRRGVDWGAGGMVDVGALVEVEAG